MEYKSKYMIYNLESSTEKIEPYFMQIAVNRKFRGDVPLEIYEEVP